MTAFINYFTAQYGKPSTTVSEEFGDGFKAFKLWAIQDLRKGKGLTQAQLVEKCGATKTYTSRIENDASNPRLSMLMRIIWKCLGGYLKLSVE